MDPVEKHSRSADVSFDGGDLDCGNGLLLLIRKHLDPLSTGQVLEIISSETSVDEDLPAWCRLTGNDLLSWTRCGKQRSFLVCRGSSLGLAMNAQSSLPPTKGLENDGLARATGASGGGEISIVETQRRKLSSDAAGQTVSAVRIAPVKIAPLSVMGVGSWPRPIWLLPYLHDHLEGKLSDEKFGSVANDAVRLAVQAQLEAGMNVLSDGEQRRDNYASFVGRRLEGCQLIPLTDLLPLVDDPEKFKEEMKSLDVPAEKVRHPAVFEKLSRKNNLALDEFSFLVTEVESKKLRNTGLPIALKVALPGPYLLTRMMWMECITDKAYGSREELSKDIVRLLREELSDLLDAGASVVQFDEPVLTEVVFTGAKNARSFMCGALSERGSSEDELEFARDLINGVCDGFPADRIAMHVCRGNWTPDENMALSGDYSLLLPLFNQLKVGRLILEFCTPRAGDLHVLKNLRPDLNLGLGIINPKTASIESVDSILARARECIELLGWQRVTLNPDCGFATFADSPVNSSEIAKAKMMSAVKASLILQSEFK